MEAARHDSLADQLLELHAIEEARTAAEEEARVQAALAARQREEAEARQRHEQEAEAQRRAEEQALAEARAQREAEERQALDALEADLRVKLEDEAQVRAAELQHQLERQTEATVSSGVEKAKVRTRQVMVAAIAIALIAAGAYGFIVRPTMERQALELESARQEMQLLVHENARLAQELDETRNDLARMELENRELKQRPKPQNTPKQSPAASPKRERRRVKKSECANSEDPLCGIPLK